MSSDWGLALLPIACLWKSQLRPVKKIVICSLMGMGILYVNHLLQRFSADGLPQHWGLPISTLALDAEFCLAGRLV